MHGIQCFKRMKNYIHIYQYKQEALKIFVRRILVKKRLGNNTRSYGLSSVPQINMIKQKNFDQKHNNHF